MQLELIGGRYHVVRAIGQGGMGTVWLCRDQTLQRDVAVKQVGLLPGESLTDSARALREARSSAALGHRNVVTVFDVVEEAGAIWLVMEHVPSRSLAELVREEGPLDPAQVAALGAQVADGLAAAHAAGTIHRDVKPGNVLVREDGLAKISDFGIARTGGDPTLTQTGLVTGTPSYFSPELARGAAPAVASDVWALGATLYAAVEGRPPYRPQENPVAVLHEIATTQPPAPKRAAYLEPVLLRMLDRDPESRWSMADAAHALGRLAREHSPERTRWQTQVDPTTTPPESVAATTPDRRPRAAAAQPDPPPSERRSTAPAAAAARPGRRRRGATTLAALAVLVVVVVAGVGYLLTRGEHSGTGSASPGAGSSNAGGSPSSGASASPSSPAAGSATGGPSKASFVRGYFAVAPGGTDEAWAQLGPGEKAQGRASYDGFWRRISSVDVSHVDPIAGTDSVELTLQYHTTSGGTSTERQRLDLVRSADGGYLINNDDPVR